MMIKMRPSLIFWAVVSPKLKLPFVRVSAARKGSLESRMVTVTAVKVGLLTATMVYGA